MVEITDKWLWTYKNSTEVITINGYPIKVDDLIAASLIGGLNLLLVSGRGEGKTQILYDVLYGVFGGRGNYIRVSSKMEIDDIYTALNLEKLAKKIGTSKDIVEITPDARFPYTAIDELNRAPPIVQNQLLNVLDGYIEVNGKQYMLGIPIEDGNYYHVGIATINYGDGYTGTFSIDTATLDRFTLVLDIDNFYPAPHDMMEILISSESSRLNIPPKRDRTTEIIEHHKKIKRRKVPVEVYLGILYLIYGLDYIPVKPYSQRKVKGELPEGVHEGGGLPGIMRPITTRTAKQIIELYKSLDYLTEVYGEKNSKSSFSNFLELLTLVLPFSGSLREDVINSRFYGNPLLAVEEIKKSIKDSFEGRIDELLDLFEKIKNGKNIREEDLNSFEGEWGFVKEIILEELKKLKR